MFTQRVFTTSGNLIKQMKNVVSQIAKTRCGNPYKTCVKLMIFESKSQIGFQNEQKSIGIIDKTHMAFRHVENLIKPVENECSGCHFLPYWVPLGPPDFYHGHLKKYPKGTFPFRKISLSVFSHLPNTIP